MADKLLRCAHCPFTTPLWVDDGPVGYEVMARHFHDEHAEEHRLVQEGLAEMDEDIRLAEEEAEGTY